MRSDRDRGAFHRRALWVIARIAPRSRPSEPLFHAAPVPRRTPTLCRVRELAPLLPPRDARHDEPSIRYGSIERSERLVASPLPNLSIAAPKTASVTDAARGVMCRELREDLFATIAAQMKEKRRCKPDFLLHRFPTSTIGGFPHVSYGLSASEASIDASRRGRRDI